jgi:hypothetical protein
VSVDEDPADVSYGDLGRAIMINHFQNLIQWGHLVLGPNIEPLPSTEFIITVLVPEAAVLLTMEDGGFDGSIVKGEEWDKAREPAMEICQRAGRYGYWRFRGDGEEGRRVLERLEKAAPEKRRRLDDARRELSADIDRKIRAEKGSVIQEAILVGSSDTEQPDESDWGDDVWNDEAAVAEAAAAADRRAAMRRLDPDATPKAVRRPLSPLKVESSPLRAESMSPLPMKKASSFRGSLSPVSVKKGKAPLKSLSQQSAASSCYDDWDDQFMGQAVATMDEVTRGSRR